VWTLGDDQAGVLYYANNVTDTVFAFADSSWIPTPAQEIRFDTAAGWQWTITDSIIDSATVLHRSVFGPAPGC